MARKIDAARGLALWRGEMTTAGIARVFGVHPHTLRRFAKRHGWPERPQDTPGRRVQWDVEHGYALWHDEAMTIEAVARALGIGRETLRSYAAYHDWAPKGVPRQAPSRRRCISLVATPQKPVRDRALVVAKWERRRYLRRVRDKIESARPLMTLYDVASRPRRGRPKQSIGRAANASERAA